MTEKIIVLQQVVARCWTVLDKVLADGEGFEPSRRLRVCRFSRPVPSTTRPPILRNNLKWLAAAALATNRELQPDCNRRTPIN
jgi:hypothetical protein